MSAKTSRSRVVNINCQPTPARRHHLAYSCLRHDKNPGDVIVWARSRFIAMSEAKTNVPKFASFRPKPNTPAPDAARASERTSERKHYSSREDGTREKDHRQRHHKRHRSRSKERTPDRKTEIEPSRIQPKDETATLFVVDKKGDEKNLVYGSIHRYSVPPFHRFGAGHVLGALPSTKIDRDYGDEKGIVLSNWRNFRSDFREKYVFSKLDRDKPRLLKICHEVESEVQEIVEQDFVPLQPRGKKRKRRRSDDADSFGSDHDERDYRSIYGTVKGKNQPLDDNLQYATESDSSGSEAGRTIKVDVFVRQKNVELSRKVEELPHDVEAWIALIEHQDALTRAQDDRRSITNAEIRSTADIKIHMYEKALDKTKSLPDREKLLLGMMKEGEKIWEIKVQAERWEQISKDNIDSLLLWTSYLNFKQTNFSTFRHEEVKEIFAKRINTLLEAIVDTRTGNPDSLYHQLIYVLLRFTLFLRESGYSELAVSIWQGLLEMNFFFPKSPLFQAEVIRLFSEFWESEVPRVGEDCALGWRHFVENEGASEAPDTLVDEAEDAINDKDLFGTWAAAERLRNRSSRAPARTMNEVIEDDPFRVILFSDIEKFLIQLPVQSEDLRILLLNGFLLFCRLPPVTALELEDAKKWSKDSFVNGNLLEYNMSWIGGRYFEITHEGSDEPDVVSSLNVPIPNNLVSLEMLFGSGVWPRNQSWRDKYSGDDNSPVPYKSIRNTLGQLAETHFADSLAEYYLAFEFLNEPATIKKISKNLLKKHPTSLRLYNSYALIEWSRGNKDVARSVFSAALNLHSTLSESVWSRDSIMLWRSWIWACLVDQENSAALQLLLSITDGTPNPDVTISPAVLLKTKQHLTSRRDYLISSGSSNFSVAYAQCS